MSDLAEEMKQDALEAQKFSRKHLVLELDFSEESIGEVDSQADSVEYALRGGKSEENVAMLTRLWGAYLGEAIRKKAGGEWTRDDEGQLCLKTEQKTVRPQQRVHQRLMEGAEHNLTQFYQDAVAGS